MKRRAAFGLAALLAVGACTGISARDDVLIPALHATYVELMAPMVDDALGRLAPEDRLLLAEAASGLLTALATGDRGAVSLEQWDLVRGALDARIRERVSAGDIGPGVGISLLQAVVLFDRQLRLLVAR